MINKFVKRNIIRSLIQCLVKNLFYSIIEIHLKKIKVYISIIIFVLNISCTTNHKTDVLKIEELDRQKTTELIAQILKEEAQGYLISSCITEGVRGIPIPMVLSFKDDIRHILKIKDSVHLNSQFRLYKKFKVTSNLVPNKNILTEKQFEEFERKYRKDGFSFWDWLEKNCEKGYCSIGKPIFNETFDLAYIQIGRVCGPSCGGGDERIYELINGKWKKKKTIGNWVS